ncbi:Holliday junction resolvase RuvX [Bacillus cereus]|uniref:Holliday junction resolvase RuvX n=1 Tax=Bacillus cereus TaxID=1396 RepID=UPI000BF72455|nr:Holliday junction resolvase RuvX [Bacillus cereus]PFR35985.1 Holliday junction resolvase RuvX [Bacillus cereus]PFW24996.1 Holliday junction resolvase RuvX [Bacillus cereus]
MRILGLDVGTKTVGVAISDEMGWTAQGLETIKINEERGHFGFDRISELVKQYNVDKIVVGLPKNMNGTIGPRGKACQQFAENLRELLQLDVVMWDERLSTMAAERLLISADVSRKKRKQVIDKMAAVVILQGFLDSK